MCVGEPVPKLSLERHGSCSGTGPPGQSWVVGEASWQSIWGLTSPNCLETQSTSQLSPPCRRKVGNHCYPQLMNFCQDSSLSFLVPAVLLPPGSCLEKILACRHVSLPGRKLAILLCRARVLTETHNTMGAQDCCRNGGAGGTNKCAGEGHLAVRGLFR